MLACLLASLIGCAHEVVSAPPQVIKVTPPAALLLATPSPDFAGSTNGDLVLFIDELQAALDVCNADKAAVRGFIAQPAE
jgi:hypothetical protein